MRQDRNQPTGGTSPLYTPKNLQAAKRATTRDLDGAFRFTGRKFDKLSTAEIEALTAAAGEKK